MYDYEHKHYTTWCTGCLMGNESNHNLMLVHAFYQLPKQKEFWQDASGRQSASMIMFFVFMAGAMIPSFDKAVIKK